MICESLDENTVWITPIITRVNEAEIAEVGAGGGGGDLTKRPELEVDNDNVVEQLLEL
jgi:DNA cross-link repair 1C protein